MSISTVDHHSLDLLDDLDLLVVHHLNQLAVQRQKNEKWIEFSNSSQKIFDMMGIRAL